MAMENKGPQTVVFQRNAYESARARHVEILGRAGQDLERALLAFILRAGKAERLATSVGQTAEALAFNGLATVAKQALAGVQPFVSKVAATIPQEESASAASAPGMTRAQIKESLRAEARAAAGLK